jgi:hypothetical protein
LLTENPFLAPQKERQGFRGKGGSGEREEGEEARHCEYGVLSMEYGK